MKIFSLRRMDRARGRWAVLLSVTLHGVIFLALWRSPTTPTTVKKPTPVEARIVMLLCKPADDDTKSIQGDSQQLQPMQSSKLPNDLGPRQGKAGLQAPWLQDPPEIPMPKKEPPAFFGIALEGGQIVYVVDSSASMGRTGAFALAKQQLLAGLERLPNDVEFQVVVYNKTPSFLLGSHMWLRPVPGTVAKVAQALNRLRAEGSTNHLRALEKGLWLGADALFLLTDANDLSPADLQKVNQRNRDKTVVNVVRIGEKDVLGSWTWEMLAKRNRGVYRVVQLP